MNEPVFFWTYYLLGIAALLASFFLGSLIMGFVPKRIQLNDFSFTFFSVLLGLCLFVSGFAIYITTFKTVLIALPILIVALIYSLKKKEKLVAEHFRFVFPVRSLFFLLVGFTLFFLMRVWLLTDTKNLLATPHPDELFSAKLSVFIQEMAIENFSLDYIYPQDLHPQPYHFFEIWLTSLLGLIPGMNNVYVLQFDVYVLLCAVCVIGFCGVLGTISRKQADFVVFLFALFALYFTGIDISFFSEVPLLNTASTFARNPWNYSKLVVVYVFLLAALQLWLLNQKKEAVYSLLFLPVVFISTAPAVLTTVSLVLLIDCWKAKSLRGSQAGFGMITIVLALFLWLFVFGKPMNSTGTGSYHSSVFDLVFFSLDYFKTAFNVLAGTAIVILAIYLPVMVISVFVLIRSWREWYRDQLIWIILGVLILSALAWAAFHRMPDSVQLFSNISVSILNISAVIVLWMVFAAGQSVFLRVAALVVFIVMLVSPFISLLRGKVEDANALHKSSIAFAEQLMSERDRFSSLGAFVKAKEEYNSIFTKNSSFSVPASYLILADDHQHVTSLSVYDIPLDSTSTLFPFEEKMVASAPFFKFVEYQKSTGTYVSLEQSMVQFVKSNSIRYLVLSTQATLPAAFTDMAGAALVNPINNERIIFLDY
jgi:hypothetical protein